MILNSPIYDIIPVDVAEMEKITEEIAFLVAQSGPLNGQRWPLNKSLLIGRESTCDIVVPHRQVSRHHALFNLTQDGVTIEDLDSKNGTHLNGKSVTEEVLLQDGDLIQIALAQKFAFVSSDATLPLEIQEPVEPLVEEAMNSLTQKGGRLRLEKRSRRVWIGKEEILPPLSVFQYNLLELLYENQGRVVPRSDLVVAIWGEENAYEVSEQAMDALVRRLRDRISNIDPSNTYIVTVRGHGLRLDNPSE